MIFAYLFVNPWVYTKFPLPSKISLNIKALAITLKRLFKIVPNKFRILLQIIALPPSLPHINKPYKCCV